MKSPSEEMKVQREEYHGLIKFQNVVIIVLLGFGGAMMLMLFIAINTVTKQVNSVSEGLEVKPSEVKATVEEVKASVEEVKADVQAVRGLAERNEQNISRSN